MRIDERELAAGALAGISKTRESVCRRDSFHVFDFFLRRNVGDMRPQTPGARRVFQPAAPLGEQARTGKNRMHLFSALLAFHCE
jgi:hypothetical protein